MGKFILYDFRCQACGNVFDDMVKPDVFEAPCPDCGQNGSRMISTPRINYAELAMHDGMTSAIDRFERIHYQQREIERRNIREHGEYWANRAPGG